MCWKDFVANGLERIDQSMQKGVKRGRLSPAALDGARICPPHAILASNTSSIPIIHMAVATRRPDQVLGMHFFNPVPTMKLIELVRTLTTSDETLETTCVVGEHLGKQMIVSKDRPGFIINYLSST